MTRTLPPSCAALPAPTEEAAGGGRAAAGGGTFAWAAPEVLAGRACTEKADIFSYGVVLWEVCTGDAPVRGGMRALRVPEECPEGVAELCRECTAEVPGQRPAAKDIVHRLQRLAPDAAQRRAGGARRERAPEPQRPGGSGELAALWAAAAAASSAGAAQPAAW